jgi:hypothetical protein
MLKTFKEWKLEGRHVIKGQKAHSFNKEGIALFHVKQTDRTRYYSDIDENDIKYEDNFDFWKKASPYGLLKRIEKNNIEVSDEDWKSLMYEIERIECY